MTLLATEQSAWVHSALKENVKVKVRGRPWMSAVTAAIEKSSSSCVSFQTAAVSSHGAPLTGRSSAKTPSEKFICCHSGTKKKASRPDEGDFISSLSEVWAGSGFIVSGIFFSSFRLRSHHQFSRRCGMIAQRRFSSRLEPLKRNGGGCGGGRVDPPCDHGQPKQMKFYWHANKQHTATKTRQRGGFSFAPVLPFFPPYFYFPAERVDFEKSFFHVCICQFLSVFSATGETLCI